MDKKSLLEMVSARFGDRIECGPEANPTPFIIVRNPQKDLLDIVKTLRDDSGFSFKYLATVAATDHPPVSEKKGEPPPPGPGHQFSTAVLKSYEHGTTLMVKAKLDRNNPHVPSLAGLYGAAIWHEREQYDLLGVIYDGHPDLRRIMLPDDWTGHPLRKDWTEQDNYRGIQTTRESMHDIFARRVKETEGYDFRRGGSAAGEETAES
ncbi:MAG: NADH-quinone oxidoreductase subunit C [Deltaproteobacteria bacterium]|nr:NADH-quinone oxidoreductase subunit C [Deltaproteobacteria bacterium]